MSREDIPWILLVIVLLVGGLWVGQRFLSSESDQGPQEDGASVSPFREWFWESRSLDLAVQVGLVFVGALSIAALLPRSKEDE